MKQRKGFIILCVSITVFRHTKTYTLVQCTEVSEVPAASAMRVGDGGRWFLWNVDILVYLPDFTASHSSTKLPLQNGENVKCHVTCVIISQIIYQLWNQLALKLLKTPSAETISLRCKTADFLQNTHWYSAQILCVISTQN